MSKMSQISIKKPCHLTWDSLEGKGCERFCASCSSTVVDLTSKSNAEIISLISKEKGRVCGLIRQEQMDMMPLQHKSNTGLFRSFFAFVFGFATVTTTQAAANEFTPLTYLEVPANNPVEANKADTATQAKADTLYKVSGHVLDNTSQKGLPGVSVAIKGTHTGTATNKEGRFELSVPKDEAGQESVVLVFMFLGYTTKELELPIKDTDNIEVKLEVSAALLGEVYISEYKSFWWRLTSPFRRN